MLYLTTKKSFSSSILILLLAACILGCQERKPVFGKQAAKRKLSEEFNKYWYANDAEITSYKLNQARYGEMREGSAVLIFVTEHFLNEEQVKADEAHDDNIAVLKLNAVKKFNTGIYPYSIMTSTFFPVVQNRHALKVTNSVQEWCGQVYAQLNSRAQFEITSHSYFEGEADQNFKLDKEFLEDELWIMIRISPDNLPFGEHLVIPSMEFTRLNHKEFKAYACTITKEKGAYKLTYPDLDRTLTIQYNSQFPYDIEGWTETFPNGPGSNAKELTTTATKLKTLKTAYWKQNAEKFSYLRDSLAL